MESEADLDAAIRSLSILSEHPELFTEFAKTGTLGSLVGLLAHENTDIAIEVVQVLSELTDDEVDAEPEQWNALVKGMVGFPSCSRVRRMLTVRRTRRSCLRCWLQICRGLMRRMNRTVVVFITL